MKHYDRQWLTESIKNGFQPDFLLFWGHQSRQNQTVGNFIFSQWWASPFKVDNVIYKTTEHWMMANKASLFSDTASIDKILQADTPKEAKALGRQVSNFEVQLWDRYKFEIVKLGNLHKFKQYPDYTQYLLDTGSKIIVEASPTDTVWGIGLTADSKDSTDPTKWRGENLLGFALMEVRDILKSEQTPATSR